MSRYSVVDARLSVDELTMGGGGVTSVWLRTRSAAAWTGDEGGSSRADRPGDEMRREAATSLSVADCLGAVYANEPVDMNEDLGVGSPSTPSTKPAAPAARFLRGGSGGRWFPETG